MNRPAQSALIAAALWAAASGAAPAQSGPDGLTLLLDGECPGRITFAWNGATPDRYMGILFARNTGNFTMNSPCDGTVLGLGTNMLQLVSVVRTGPQGRGRVSGQAQVLFCGGYVQLIVIEGRPCPTSNVVQVPR